MQLKLALRKRDLNWTAVDDDDLAAAIRDHVAGIPPKEMRPIVARQAEIFGEMFSGLLELAEASVEGPPDGYEPPDDDEPTPPKPSKPDVSLPIVDPVAEPPTPPTPPTPPPTDDVKEYFDEMGRA